MKHGTAYTHTRYLYDNSPGRSWLRLNGSLRKTLEAAIIAHMTFNKDDFAAIYNDMKGSYWMGNSCGSTCGEALYCLAVDVGHTQACIAFEHFVERPPVLWPEAVKTPERLCIGKRFTWITEFVTITNMFSDHLVACTYKKNSNKVKNLYRITYQKLSERRKELDAKCKNAIDRIAATSDMTELGMLKIELLKLQGWRPFDVDQLRDALTKQEEKLSA